MPEPVKTITVEVLTTTVTAAVLWADIASEDRHYEIYVTAAETTGGSFANYRMFAKRFVRYSNFEATVLSTETDIHADVGTGGSSAWTCTVQLDVGDDTEIRVVGAASTDITWRAEIRYLKIRP